MTDNGMITDEDTVSVKPVGIAAVAVGVDVLLFKTLPIFAMPSDREPFLFPTSVPIPKRAQTPRKTMLAPRRLARELALRTRGDPESAQSSASSSSNSPSRRPGLPRFNVPASSAGRDVICNEEGIGLVGILPTLPLLP
jgi:hypothetical protein